MTHSRPAGSGSVQGVTKLEYTTSAPTTPR